MMTKKLIYSLWGLFLLAAIFESCSSEGLQLYDRKKGMISFNADEPSSTTFTFMSRPAEVKQDTVWFTIDLIGFSSDRDRYFALEQILPKDTVTQDSVSKPTDQPKPVIAQAGVHYLDFDSPEAKRIQRFPANAIRAKVPVVLLRDTSLKTKEVTLNFKLKVSDDFDLGYKEYQTRTVIFSDKLTRPSLWQSYFWGDYGPKKHEFMIQATGKAWDDEYLKKVGFELINGTPNAPVRRQAYIQWIMNNLYNALEKENAARQARGEDVLREDDGTKVEFKKF